VGADTAVFEMQMPDIDIESGSRVGKPFSYFARGVGQGLEGRGSSLSISRLMPVENIGLGERDVLCN
jgi:hypothetical protein